LTVAGKIRQYGAVYRKVQAVKLDVLAMESTASEEYGTDWQEELESAQILHNDR